MKKTGAGARALGLVGEAFAGLGCRLESCNEGSGNEYGVPDSCVPDSLVSPDSFD
jgi:hypothetical protein